MPLLSRGRWTLLAALAVAAAVLAAAHLPPVKSIVAGRVIDALGDAGIAARVARLDYNLLARRVTAHGVRLASASSIDTPFLEADRIEVRLPWRTVIGRLALDSVDISGTTLTIVVDADGHDNLPAAGEGDGGLSRLDIARASVRGFSVHYDHHGDGVHVAASDLSLDLNPVDRGARGRFATGGPVVLEFGTTSLLVRDVAGYVEYDGASVALEELRLEIIGHQAPTASPRPATSVPTLSANPAATPPVIGSVELNGIIEHIFVSPSIEATAAGRLHVGGVARWLDVDHNASGRVDWHGTLTGPLGAPIVEIEARGDDLVFETLEAITVDATLSVSADAFTVDRLSSTIAGGDVVATGTIGFEGGASNHVAASWTGLSAAAIADAAGLALPIGARLDGTIDATWGASLESLALTLRHDARPTTFAHAIAVEGHAALAADGGQWTLEHAHHVGDGVTLSGHAGGRLGRDPGATTLAGTVTFEAPRTAALTKLARAAGMALPPDIDEQVDARVAVDGTLAGTIGDPRLSGALALDDLRVDAARGGRVRAGWRVDGAVLTIGDLNVALDAITARGTAVIDVDRGVLGGTLATTVSDLDVVNRLVASEDGEWPAAGSLTADITLGGTTTRPQVGVEARLHDIVAFGQPWASAEAVITATGPRISIDRLAAQQGRGQVELRGWVDLAREEIDITIDAHGFVVHPIERSRDPGDAVPVEAIVDLVQGELRGEIARLDGRGRLDLSGVGVDDHAIGRLGVDLVVERGVARFDLLLHDLDVEATGRVATTTPWDFEVTAKVDTDDLRKPLPADLRETSHVTGRLAVEATATGRLANLEAVDVAMSLLELDAFVGQTPLALDRAEPVRWSDGVVDVGSIALTLGQVRLSAAGRLGRIGDELRFGVNGPIADFAALLTIAGVEAVTPAEGLVDARVVIGDTLERPVIDADLRIAGASVMIGGSPALSVPTLDVSLREGVLRLDRAELGWLGARAQATGHVPLGLLSAWLPDGVTNGLAPTTETARIEARVEDLDQRALAPFVDADTLAAVQGAFAATASLEADEARLSAIRGTVVFDRAAIEIAQVPLAQTAPTRLVINDGRLRVEEWVWSGAGNRLEVVGGLSFTDEGDVRFDAAADALVDLRFIGAFVDGLSTAGRIDVSVAAGGPIAAPEIDGRVIVSAAEARLASPRLAIGGITGSLILRGDELRVDRLVGTANGGPVTVSGLARFPEFGIGELDVALTGRRIAIEPVDGLQTEVDVDLRLVQPTPAAVARLAGEVAVLRGGYRRALSLAQLLRTGGPSAPAAVVGAAPTGLMATRLDVAVATREDLAFDNNYGRFEMGADLRVIGTLAEPALAGRAELREGGQVFLGGNRYQLERGTIDFTNPTRIEPDIDLTTRTRVRGYDITLNVSGTPDTIMADLTSDDPSLGQGDLVSLLLTGRTRDETGGAEAEVARDQLLGLLSGELLGAAGRAVGLDAVRIERGDSLDTFDVGPWALADETDPSSRLTLSKNLGQQFELALSQSLRDSNALTWIATYRPGRRIDLRVVSRDNREMAYEVRQDISFGGGAASLTPRRTRPPAARVARVVIEGVDDPTRAALERRLRLRSGSRFDFFRWQDDRERLLAWFHEAGHYEATVAATREETSAQGPDAEMTLTFAVDAGPRTVLDVNGFRLDRRAEREMVDAWTRNVFDGFLLDDLRTIAERALLGEGHLEARVAVAVTPESTADEKRIVVDIEAGPRIADRRVEFSGHRSLSARRLEQVLAEAGVAEAAWREPSMVDRPIRAAYEREGRLAARVARRGIDIDGSRARLVIEIEEGPAFRVGDVIFTGVRGLSEVEVREAWRLESGDEYDPNRVDTARRLVEQAYRRQGFNALRLVVRQRVNGEAATVDLAVDIEEGPRQILADVVVDGADRTRTSVVERALRLEPGAPVDLSEWYLGRRRLYQTGVFRRADVEAELVDADATPDRTTDTAGAHAGTGEPQVEAVRARVSLVEWPIYRFRYGFQVTDDRAPSVDQPSTRPGVVFDLQRRNLLGIADSTGIAVRIENRRQLVRTFASTPRFFALPLATNVFVTRSRESFGDPNVFRYVTTRWDVAAEQRYRRGRAMSFNYGYRYEWNRTFDPDRDPTDPFGLDITINIARLTSGLAVDRRDDPFDATRGWLHTSNVEYSSERLGSDLRFVKYLLQHFNFTPVGRRVVLASAARIGLSDGFGQEIVPSERFFAGGGTSVRGFAEDSLGERGFLGDPRGGEAMLVLNQEVRFPLAGFLRGVAFVDAGNVFANPARVALRDLEVGVGGGLRIDTPFALVRVDYGIPVSRPRGARGGTWYFSIGQAF